MLRLLLLLLFLILPCQANADTLTLTMARRENQTDYLRELLTTALQHVGHELQIKDKGFMPQIWRMKMMDAGRIDLNTYIQTSERDARWTLVGCDILDGLIGHRILLVPKKDAQAYAGVQTLEDFRALGKVGGFGKNWYDIDVWKANQLPYKVSPTIWQSLFNVVASGNRGIDYFSRGFTEILEEASEHPRLAIEPHLMLVYERPFCFYLSKNAAHLKPMLESALRTYMQTPEYKELLARHLAEEFEMLQPQKRRVLQLEAPLRSLYH